MPLFCVCPDGRSAREWFPPEWDESLPLDCRYFGAALAGMDKRLFEDGEQAQLHIYLTYNTRALPEYGSHVVALLLSDEIGLIPRYARHVLMLFKTHRIRPVLGSRTWWRLDQLHIALWLKLARNCCTAFALALRICICTAGMAGTSVCKDPGAQRAIGILAPGTSPAEEDGGTPVPLFFAGGGNLELPFWRRLIPSPKETVAYDVVRNTRNDQ